MGRNSEMKKVMSILLGTAVLGSLLTGCQNTEAATTIETTPTEETVEARDSVEAWGSVSADTMKEIYIDFPATVNEIYIKEGQEVKQGDKLLGLDYEAYKTSILQKEIGLTLDKATLDGAITSSSGSVQQISNLQNQANAISQRLTDGTDTEIATIEASIKLKQSELTELQKDLEVQKELVEAGATMQREVDNLNVKITNLKTEIGNLEQQITNIKKDKTLKINEINSQVAGIKDTLNTAEKGNQSAINTYSVKQDLSNLEVQLMKDKYTKAFIKDNDIILDIPNGIIKAVKVVEGSKVGSESGCLLEILDKDSIVIKANVSEEFIKDVKVGAEAEIIPYADRESVVKGRVIEIQNMAIDVNGETVIPIVVEALEDSPYLKYGYSVDVEIYTE